MTFNADGAFWDAVNQATTEAEQEPVTDVQNLSRDEYAAYRQGRVRNVTNVFGVDPAEDPITRARKLAEAMQQSEAPVNDYATKRAEAGIKDVSSVFGASRPNPRSQKSPWVI